MKTYCAAAFTQIYADNASKYRLCCHGGQNKSISKYNTNNCNPFEFFMSDEMEQIRNDMLSGKKIQGCEVCYKAEEKGGKSYRQWKYNKTYEKRLDPHRVHLKLRIMGSFCNLGCYMCHPHNSSTRRLELKKSEIDWVDSEKFISTGTKRFEESVQDILNNIELVETLNITGGEPLQLDRMWQMMEKIPPEYAKNINLSFDTNLTKLKYKQWSVWQLIDKFKEVRLGVSCDHFGDKLAWIRYPIDVHEFEKNLEMVKNYVTNIHVTASILNIYDLFEIKKYYKDYNVNFNSVVEYPKMLSIRNLPDKNILINAYEEPLKEFPILIQELKKDIINGELEKGIKYCKDLNSMRNIDFKKLFPRF